MAMNSVVGGVVYAGGEMAVQQLARDQSGGSIQYDLHKIRELGALGTIENGIVMLTWYRLLSRYVGDGNATKTVLLKCLLDQLFFASQQDLVFLGFCAVRHSTQLPDAVKEVNRNLLTTWINDCSLWPVINFVGFAAVPTIMQPTYISFVQFFWQVYISSVVMKASSTSSTSSLPNTSDNQSGGDLSGPCTDSSGITTATDADATSTYRELPLSDVDNKLLRDFNDIDADGVSE